MKFEVPDVWVVDASPLISLDQIGCVHLLARLSMMEVIGYATAAAPAWTRGGQRAEPGERPYLTEIWGLEPLNVVCDCPDFLRSSLGLCKHLLCRTTPPSSVRRKLIRPNS